MSTTVDELGDRIAAKVTDQVSEYLSQHQIEESDFTREEIIRLIDSRAGDGSGGNVARTGDIVHAGDFGADGDGNSDDTDELQETIDKAEEIGGIAYIPEGTFNISRPLTGTEVTIRAAGPEKTTLSGVGSVGKLIYIKGLNPRLFDIELDGRYAERGKDYNTTALQVEGSHRPHVRNIVMRDCGPSSYAYLWADEPDIGSDRSPIHVTHGVFEDITIFDRDANSEFGFRPRVEWRKDIPNGEWSARNAYNLLRNITIYGTYKSAIELVGANTHHNVVAFCKSHGKYGWSGAIEADKGASYNLFLGNVVEDMKADPSHSGAIYGFLCLGEYPNSAGTTHPNRPCTGNTFLANEVRDSSTNNPSANLRAFSAQNAVDTGFILPIVDNIGHGPDSDSTRVKGIDLWGNTRNTRIIEPRFRNIEGRGIELSDLPTKTHISGGSIEAQRAGIHSSETDIKVSDIDITTETGSAILNQGGGIGQINGLWAHDTGRYGVDQRGGTLVLTGSVFEDIGLEAVDVDDAETSFAGNWWDDGDI